MGLRFRKTAKICKGVKINFAKTGASLSFGGPGNSVNVGSKGVKHTIGVPGTGISYRSNIGHKSSSSNNSKTKNTHNSMQTNISVQVIMDSDGRIKVLGHDGVQITDEAMLRKIKNSEVFQEQKRLLDAQRKQMLTQAFNDSVAENERLVFIHRLSPIVDTLEAFQSVYDSMRPCTYHIPPYSITEPNKDTIRYSLIREAESVVKGNIFTIRKRRKQYVESRLEERFDAAKEEWQRNYESYMKAQKELESSKNEWFFKDYEKKQTYLKKLICGDPDAIINAIEEWITSCALPVETNIDFEFFPDKECVYLDVDLPEIEDLPALEVVRLQSGNLREKKKTQTTLKQEYVNLTLGLAIFISANIFNISPAIRHIIISGYTQRRNKDGDLNDDYVYSIIFDRESFESSNLSLVDPMEYCLSFENRLNITTTMIMKPIKPFEII